MAFTGNYLCTSFKQQLLEGVHDFRVTGGDTFKLALYTDLASFDASTTSYTATDEVPDSGSYAAGGGTLVRMDPTTFGTTAYTSFDDLTFTGVTITARGALIYNSTPAHTYTNPVVAVLDFGFDVTVVGGNMTIMLPAANATSAIIRIT